MVNKVTVLFLLLCLGTRAQQVSRILPEELRDIPTGIAVMHDPSPVYPEPNTDTLNYKGQYVWKHATTARSLETDLTVVAAGSYIWLGTKGWLPNVKLDQDGFAERFRCRDGVLKKGISYTFVKNWRYGDKIYAGDALWFVLAKNARGQMYKGIAIVETEGTLKNKNHIK